MNSSFGILASGNLGYLSLLFIEEKYIIDFIFTDLKSDEIINFASKRNIPVFIGNPRDGKAINFLKNKKVDYLISINYLFIIENDLINFPEKFAINIHGSLLPKYRGRTPHIWSIINNEKETGITAHILTEMCDRGDIIHQESILIEDNITGNELLEKYKLLYPNFICKVLEKIHGENIKFIKQDENLATWFNKRTPKDGQIIWSWQKERIYNWVRALSEPYPGAYSFYENEMIIIDKIEKSNFGFCQDIENGEILKGGYNPIIKTSNGAIKILKYRGQLKKFSKGNKFYERY
jgi:methionyl-tRNA formyltransferase